MYSSIEIEWIKYLIFDYLDRNFIENIELNKDRIYFATVDEFINGGPGFYILLYPNNSVVYPTKFRQIIILDTVFTIGEKISEIYNFEENQYGFVKNSNSGFAPSWDFLSLVFPLIKGDYEKLIKQDHLGRVNQNLDKRSSELLLTPFFNEFIALLVATAYNGRLKVLNPVLKCPTVFLSHDCDLLVGNDFFTQLIRFYKVFSNFFKLNFSVAFVKLKYLILNLLDGKKYYLNSISFIVKLEKKYGYKSSFYFINGKIARYGARSNLKLIELAIKLIPDGWDIGLHYNYNTLNSKVNFLQQKCQLESILPSTIFSGRAHYLKYSNIDDLLFYSKMGIKVDESTGYSERQGFRYGIGSPFTPFEVFCSNGDLVTIPLTFMDSNIVLFDFEKLVNHISKIGGSISILFHNDLVNNPEYELFSGLYEKLLQALQKNNFIYQLPSDLIK
jgi:hypothetical protein